MMRRTPVNLSVAVAAGLLLLLAFPAAALAHAERQSSRPGEGKTLKEPPLHLYVNFSEPPTGDSKITVLDGCGTDVVGDFEVTDRTIHANLEPGQPGRWRVSTDVVSGLDGHRTADAWAFEVTGAKDCSSPPPQAGDPEDGSGDEDGGLGSAVLLAAGGAVVLIGIAAAIRLRSKD